MAEGERAEAYCLVDGGVAGSELYGFGELLERLVKPPFSRCNETSLRSGMRHCFELQP